MHPSEPEDRKIRHFAFLIFTLIILIQTAQASPLHDGVLIYNSLNGGTTRLLAFMRIGASPADRVYLGFLAARLGNQPLPKAFVDGSSVYFRGMDEPLRVVDLRRRLFSLNGHTVDLSLKGGIEKSLRALGSHQVPRASWIFDWILPRAFAASSLTDGQLAGVLAVGGIASHLQCLESGTSNCGPQNFLGALSELGAVGVFASRSAAPTQVFCTPDSRGNSRFVIYGQKRAILSVTSADLSLPGPTPMRAAAPAAQDLLHACASKPVLEALNTAFAYPVDAAPALPATVAKTPSAPGPVPVPVPVSMPSAVSSSSSAAPETITDPGMGSAR